MNKHFYVLLSSMVLSFSVHAANTPVDKTPSPGTHPMINLNTADVKALSHSIKGIGEKRAEAIIKYREAHHGFKSIDELAEVPGIGKHFVTQQAEAIKKIFAVQ